MTHDPHALKIYVDGSVVRNPGGAGGIAGIVEFPDKLNMVPQTVFERAYISSTNQRMELLACIKGIEWIRDNARSFQSTRALIVTDSQYVYKYIGSAPYWKKDKWRNRDGRPIENSDLWNELLAVRSRVGVWTDFDLVKGKTTPLLKLVDNMAKKAAREGMKIPDRGYQPGKIAPTKIPGGVAGIFPAKGQEETVRIYRKSSAYGKKLTNCKVHFEIFSTEENKYPAKYFAYASPEVQIELHRHHVYRVRFNDNPRYPVIDVVLTEIA